MSMKIQIAFNGAAGRMGNRLVALGFEDHSLKIVAGVDWAKNPSQGKDIGDLAGIGALGVPLSADIPLDVRVDTLIDFSTPEGTMSILKTCLERKIPLVVATTCQTLEQKHSLEFLREKAHLRFRTNTFGSVFRLRHALAFATHQFYNERGFVYLHTPIITSSDAEGAGEMFRVTTLPLEGAPKNDKGEIDYTQDFFGKGTNLTVSGQLEGELGAMV